MPFSASAIFCFASSPSAKHFPLRTFFIRGKQTNKKGCSGQSGWRGRVGRRGHAIFGQKRLHTQCSVGRCTSPIMKRAKALKESSKKYSLKLNAASYNNASWYTDTDGSLEHSPGGGKPVLQGTCPPEDNSGFFFFFWKGPPCIIQKRSGNGANYSLSL